MTKYEVVRNSQPQYARKERLQPNEESPRAETRGCTYRARGHTCTCRRRPTTYVGLELGPFFFPKPTTARPTKSLSGSGCARVPQHAKRRMHNAAACQLHYAKSELLSLLRGCRKCSQSASSTHNTSTQDSLLGTILKPGARRLQKSSYLQQLTVQAMCKQPGLQLYRLS